MSKFSLNYLIENDRSSIKDIMTNIKRSGKGICFIINNNSKIIGTITDGDIRRKLLQGHQLKDECQICINKNFIYLKENYKKEDALKLFDTRIKSIPILNKKKEIVDILFDSKLDYPNIIEVTSKSPARISLAGGGTDMTEYFIKNKGLCLTMAINLYAKVNLKRRIDSKIIINSKDYKVKKSFLNISKVKINSNMKIDLICASIIRMSPNFGFELTVSSEFSPKSGLGGSSAITASIIKCFALMQNKVMTNYEIAELAFQIERIDLNIKGGWQDQYGSVFGGVNEIEFSKKLNVVYPIKVNNNILDQFLDRLVLVSLNKPHKGELIHKNKLNENTSKKVGKLKDISRKILQYLLKEEFENIGKLFDRSWKIKKQINSSVTNSNIDKIYNEILDAGAIGGRLLGSGGGGHFLFFLPIESRDMVIKKIKKLHLKIVKFQIDQHGTVGWKVKN